MGKGEGYFTGYPKHVFFILGNEFCERFSFYGMKAILVLYFTRALDYSDNTSTAIYHAFNMVCYFMPIFGAMLADGYLGKFRTILYLSVVYSFGNLAMALGAIPNGDTYYSWATFIALTLIAIGTGGIKPCVSAFGADQFKDEQTRQKETFFSMFYMSINLGSLLSMLVTPTLRSKVYCFDNPCYPLAFGVPAVLMVVAVVFFIVGSSYYTKSPPGNNIIGNLFGCVGTAISGRCRKKGGPKEHWLDYSEEKYGKKFVTDVKAVMRVFFMFIPLPVFWTLFDQQGSRWILQAGQMNGDFNGFVIQPDQMHAFNPLLIVIMVPLVESLMFPCLNRLKIPNRPLQRLGAGLFLCGVSFIITGGIQILIENEAPPGVADGDVRLHYINAAPCNVTITQWSEHVNNKQILYHQKLDPEDMQTDSTPRSMLVDFKDCLYSMPNRENVNLTVGDLSDEEGYSFVFSYDSGKEPMMTQYFQNQTIRMGKGLSTIQILSVSPELQIQFDDDDDTIRNVTKLGPSAWFELYHQKYMLKGRMDPSDDFTDIGEIDSKAGAVNTVVLQQDHTGKLISVMTVHEEVNANSLNMFLQLPQYVVMGFGEVLFSVTGLSFAYSQAPPSMKAVLQAGWLLTNAVGNLIVVIISGAGIPNQVTEYFLFAGLMFVTFVIFVFMSLYYVYVEDLPPADDDDDDEKEKPPLEGLENGGYVTEAAMEKQKEAERQDSPPVYEEMDSDTVVSTAL